MGLHESKREPAKVLDNKKKLNVRTEVPSLVLLFSVLT